MKTMENTPPSETLIAPRLIRHEDSEDRFDPVGVSSAWRKLLAQARLASPHLRLATIEGEAGTGKSLLAHYLHRNSPLQQFPFLRRDAREWVSSEIDPASVQGFLYLDRVELLEPTGQNLLHGLVRAFQESRVSQLALVVSTQSSLNLLAGRGQFLPDLAFRLAAVRFSIPPLRQRKEDIPPIAQALLDRIGFRYQMRTAMLGQGTMPVLLQHNWSGNVRELACVLESALLESANGVIQPGYLNLQQGLHLAAGNFTVPSKASPVAENTAYFHAHNQTAENEAEVTNLDEMIRRHVLHVLRLSHGNKLRAAQLLGISRSTLYRIIGEGA